MKKKFKRLVCLLLAAVIFTVCIPAFAEEENDVVLIGKYVINSSGYWNLNKNGEVYGSSSISYNIAYDAETNTLTLNNADILSWHNSDYSVNVGIGALQDLNIVLIGENTVTVRSTGNDSVCGIINTAGNTNITGSGKLTIELAADNHPEVYGICTSGKNLEIKDTTVNITDTTNRDMNGVCGIYGSYTNIINSEIEMNFSDNKNVIGIWDVPENSYVKLENSDLKITLQNCKGVYGINIYEVNFDNSSIDIQIDSGDIEFERGYPYVGIFTYNFISEKSYVECEIISDDTPKYSSGILYNNFIINGKTDYQLLNYSKYVYITPEDVICWANYINSGISFYNIMESAYGGYFKIENGNISRVSEYESWNVHYDHKTNTLTLNNAHFTSFIRMNGFTNIVLKGENSIILNQNLPALIAVTAPKISGNGTLTISTVAESFITSNTDLTFSENSTVTASVNSNGSNSESYDAEKTDTYKWVKIEVSDTVEELEEPSFFERIVEFFKNIFSKIASFFKFLF